MIETPTAKPFPILRYPGGKQRLLRFLADYLPTARSIVGRYFEPFVGGAAVFLYLSPARAVLSDLNGDLIDLYRGIRCDPIAVWRLYCAFGSGKQDFLEARQRHPANLNLVERSARLLYLNRTCFKGNWRHNANGIFNVGYGGQSRRWVVSEQLLVDVAQSLANAELICSDFEPVLEEARAGDFVFLDPPYKRGGRELNNAHYAFQRFRFEDHERLAKCLRAAAERNVDWCLTTSSHPEVMALFADFPAVPIKWKSSKGDTGEVLIQNRARY